MGNTEIRSNNVRVTNNSFWGSLYGMGFLGAAYYFIEHATGFWPGVIGIAKALFWPALLMYKLLEALKM